MTDQPRGGATRGWWKRRRRRGGGEDPSLVGAVWSEKGLVLGRRLRGSGRNEVPGGIFPVAVGGRRLENGVMMVLGARSAAHQVDYDGQQDGYQSQTGGDHGV